MPPQPSAVTSPALSGSLAKFRPECDVTPTPDPLLAIQPSVPLPGVMREPQSH